MSKSSMKFFYLKGTDVPGGFFHAAKVIAVGYKKIDDNTLCLSFSRCSKADVFDRRKAALICEGRMAKGKCTKVSWPKSSDKYEILTKAAMEHDEKVKSNYRQH